MRGRVEPRVVSAILSCAVMVCALACDGRHLLGQLGDSGESQGSAELTGEETASGDGNADATSDTGTSATDTGEFACKDDIYEPNPDSTQPADPGFAPTNGANIDAEICFGDRDWYAFEVDATGTLAAAITVYVDNVELDIDVLTMVGQEPVCRWNGVDPMICGIEPGEYLLRVDYLGGKEGEPTPYNIKITNST